MVQQPAQNSRRDDDVSQEFAPLTEALVGGQDDGSPLLASGDKGEEGSGRVPGEGPALKQLLDLPDLSWVPSPVTWYDGDHQNLGTCFSNGCLVSLGQAYGGHPLGLDPRPKGELDTQAPFYTNEEVAPAQILE